MITAIDAEIRSLGLDRRASGVWAAIGNAVDEDDVSRSRGDAPTSDYFRYVRVDLVDGSRVAVDVRPPLVEPMFGPAPDFGPQKFDDIDWHEGAAFEADQPREHAFTHIGVYLAWLVRHDLQDARGLPEDHVRAVRPGEMTGSDLADDMDWKLISDFMTDEGAAFSSARYDRYLADYDVALGDRMYTVPEDDGLYERIAPVIDQLYAEWVTAGRPGPEPTEPSPDEREMATSAGAEIPWDDIGKDGPVEVVFDVDGSYEVRPIELPHVAPDLEALVPVDLSDPPMSMHSVLASQWGSSQLNRALKQLGVRPRDATVASGIGGSGERTLSVELYRVPGVAADRLRDVFAATIHRPPGSRWKDRIVGATRVSMAEGRDGPLMFSVAYWARDGLVLQVSGEAEDMEAAILRLR